MAGNADIGAHPAKSIVDAWLSKIELALQVRTEKFGKYAEEATRFFDGNHDWMWKDDYSRGVGGFLDKQGGVLPSFRITVNKLFEAVALFGPSLYHQNPNVMVSTQVPPQISPAALGMNPADPYAIQQFQMLMMQEQQEQEVKASCASVKETYLNWLQRETDKKTQSRRAITEALVAGVGYLETTMYRPPASAIQMPRSTYVSWCDVVIDPDASYWEDVQWIAIRRIRPVNITEDKYQLAPGDLKGHLQSFASQPSKKAKREAASGRSGKSFDLIEYWEVYSKNGFGDLLHDGGTIPVSHSVDYSAFGAYCHIVVSKGIPFPLNLPTTSLQSEPPEQLFERAQWPIPYWYDLDGWPISRLGFYEKPNDIWPISLFKPAIGELRFINWCMSFLADKVAASCVDYVAVLKSAGANIQKQIAGNMTPFTVIEISEAIGMKIDDMVKFLQAPNFSIDIWKMIAEVMEIIDRRTGLTELIYGLSGTQMRSATEANIRDQNVAIRPDDMASRTEDWLSEVAVREMQAARWFLGPQDVMPVVGMSGAMLWQNYILTSDVDKTVREYDFRIEAGSARKPNKANRISQLNEMGQIAMPVFSEMAAGGAVAPFNAFMSELSKAYDMDPTPFLLEPPPPQPDPEMEKMQMEMQLKMQEFELKLAEMEAKLAMQAEEHEQELEHEKEMHKLDLSQKKEELSMKKEESKAKIANSKVEAKARAQAAKKAKPAGGDKK